MYLFMIVFFSESEVIILHHKFEFCNYMIPAIEIYYEVGTP